MKNSEFFIKFVLAILLFLCLLEMPYGFYQLVRFASLIGFGIMVYKINLLYKVAELFSSPRISTGS